jgi:paraquat-inducible protein A
MLDVVVVALTCCLVRFGSLAIAEPRPGIVFFCAVVVITMISAFSFDERSIWAARAQ